MSGVRRSDIVPKRPAPKPWRDRERVSMAEGGIGRYCSGVPPVGGLLVSLCCEG